MPILNLRDLRLLSRKAPYNCPDCLHAVRRNYCREHDEFFEAGHQAPVCRNLHGTEHEKHRTY